MKLKTKEELKELEEILLDLLPKGEFFEVEVRQMLPNRVGLYTTKNADVVLEITSVSPLSTQKVNQNGKLGYVVTRRLKGEVTNVYRFSDYATAVGRAYEVAARDGGVIR